jgi:hypothetical protein
VQGKTEFVSDLLTLLQEFYQDKLRLLLRHEAAARHIGQYDINNTYQYIINREEVQLSWLASAIQELGGTFPEAADSGRTAGGSDDRKARRDRDAAAQRVIEEDARDTQVFVDRWRPRIGEMTNARHAKMLQVILGEALEQKRFFEQALAGRTDLLGRRADVLGPSHGEVLPTRWIE